MFDFYIYREELLACSGWGQVLEWIINRNDHDAVDDLREKNLQIVNYGQKSLGWVSESTKSFGKYTFEDRIILQKGLVL